LLRENPLTDPGSLFGRISILWYLLSRSLVSQAANVEFGIGEKGKPVIVRHLLLFPDRYSTESGILTQYQVEPPFSPKVEFNVSHDGGYVVLGVSRAGPIGVDVMRIPDADDDGLSNLEEALTDQVSTRSLTFVPMIVHRGSGEEMLISR
jgi:phosphopantetheinyl transferase